MLQEDSQVTVQTDNTILWTPPGMGWVKVNVDGAVSTTSRVAGCGGICRDHTGNWLAGFACAIGQCTVLEAEQLAMIRGADVAWEKGYRKVILESDSKTLVEMLKDMKSYDLCSLLCLQLQEYMAREWDLRIVYIPRKRNRLADLLAKEGLSRSVFYDVCPEHLRTLMSSEMLGFIPH